MVQDLIIDIHLLANADVSLGTYSSNIGRFIYLLRGGVDCHSLDGRGLESDMTQDATDLTDLSRWTTGGSDGTTFLVIRDGFADVDMPLFEDLESDENIWYMVNYLRSLRQD